MNLYRVTMNRKDRPRSSRTDFYIIAADSAIADRKCTEYIAALGWQLKNEWAMHSCKVVARTSGLDDILVLPPTEETTP